MRQDPDDPVELVAWLRAGFRRKEALDWLKWHIPLDQARSWAAHGVRSGLTAAQWGAAGVGPTQVDGWRHAGIGAAEAIRWHEFGIALPEAVAAKARGEDPSAAQQRAQGFALRRGVPIDMERFLKANVPREIVHGYVVEQWFDDTALDWATAGVPADQARLWMMLGILPVEAAALIKAGTTVVEVIPPWWRAGIPFDEVAVWLGAGLTAAEAVEQRAAGVTVEQAAAMRALCRQQPPR